MALPSAQLNLISTVPGVQPDTDQTNYNTNLWTFSDQVRFANGNPQKDGGYVALTFDNMAKISGAIRSIWSGTVNQQVYTLIGTSSRLYALIGSGLYNITPFSATSVAAPNSLSTQYGTLPANPLQSAFNSMIIRVYDPDYARFQVGDIVNLSGATAFAGQTTGSLNGSKIIQSVNSGYYTFNSGIISSTGTAGGGSSVVRSSGLIRVTTPNTLSTGDRVKLSYAADLAAVSATVATAGSGYAIGDTLTPVGGTPENNNSGTPQTALFTVSSNSVVSATLSAAGTGYAPANTLTVSGGTGTAATLTVATTQVVSATINAGGAGGTNGTQTVIGTTGTGTKFQASVTVAGGAITAVLSITVAGSYTVNPTLTGEPVTGAGLTGATLNLLTGVLTATVATAGSYTSDPVNPVSVTGGGTGAKFNLAYGVNTVSLTNGGLYSAAPTNPVATTTSGAGINAVLNVTYTGSTNVGGITNSQINMEFIARNITSSYYDVLTGGIATSAVTAAGGAYTVYYTPIPAGQVDVDLGQGYGAGRYGVGLYGTALQSQTSKKYPQIWFFDRYGDDMLMSPGNGGGLYQWAGSTTTAPTLVPGAPTSINYFFVSDNIIVTFGNGGTENRITASDINNPYQWTATAQNQVFDDNIEGANRLIAHAYVQGLNLIYTENQVYTFQYVGLPNVWKIQLLSNSAGIIGPLASVSVNGIAYWQGPQNWYQWSGGNVEVMPSNVLPRSTILSYVYESLNFAQQYKSFAWHNPSFNEIRFHYPDGASVDCNMAGVTNLLDMTWWPTTVNRTAAESPQISLSYPRLADVSGVIYQHENGMDANGAPLAWTVSSNLMTGSKNESLLSAFIPDSFQTGNINVQVIAQQWPQSVSPTTTKNYTITPTSGRQEMTQKPRFWQYTLSGSALGQVWNMGKWGQEYSQIGDGK